MRFLLLLLLLWLRLCVLALCLLQSAWGLRTHPPCSLGALVSKGRRHACCLCVALEAKTSISTGCRLGIELGITHRSLRMSGRRCRGLP